MSAVVAVPVEHGADCGCTRCSGFQRGNDAGEKHGCYAVLKLTPRATDIAGHLREIVPLAAPADGPVIEALGMVLAQLERAGVVLSTVQAREVDGVLDGGGLSGDDRDDLRRLASDARGWANTALRYFETLGLSPSSRVRLGLDVLRGAEARLTLTRLARLVEEEEAA